MTQLTDDLPKPGRLTTEMARWTQRDLDYYRIVFVRQQEFGWGFAEAAAKYHSRYDRRPEWVHVMLTIQSRYTPKPPGRAQGLFCSLKVQSFYLDKLIAVREELLRDTSRRWPHQSSHFWLDAVNLALEGLSESGFEVKLKTIPGLLSPLHVSRKYEWSCP